MNNKKELQAALNYLTCGNIVTEGIIDRKNESKKLLQSHIDSLPPDVMTLSELINRLNNKKVCNLSSWKWVNEITCIVSKIHDAERCLFETNIIKLGYGEKIESINFAYKSEYKWLFDLTADKTKIVNDLEEIV